MTSKQIESLEKKQKRILKQLTSLEYRLNVRLYQQAEIKQKKLKQQRDNKNPKKNKTVTTKAGEEERKRATHQKSAKPEFGPLRRRGHSGCSFPLSSLSKHVEPRLLQHFLHSPVLVFGGFGSVSDRSTDGRQNSVIIKDAETGKYFTLNHKIVGTPPTPRERHTAVAVSKLSLPSSSSSSSLVDCSPMMVVYGGRSNPLAPCDDVNVLDIDTLEWFQPTVTGNTPRGRYRHSAVLYTPSSLSSAPALSSSARSASGSERVTSTDMGNGGNSKSNVNNNNVNSPHNFSSSNDNSNSNNNNNDNHATPSAQMIVFGGQLSDADQSVSAHNNNKTNNIKDFKSETSALLRPCNELYILDIQSSPSSSSSSSSSSSTANTTADNVQWRWSQPQTEGLCPSPRHSHSSVVIGDCMYVFGGIGEGGVFENPADENLYMLHLPTLTWSKPTTTGDAPPPLYSHTASAVGHHMVVLGGASQGGEVNYSSLRVLNTRTMEWYIPPLVHASEQTKLPPPVPAAHPLSLSSIADGLFVKHSAAVVRDASTASSRTVTIAATGGGALCFSFGAYFTSSFLFTCSNVNTDRIGVAVDVIATTYTPPQQ